MQSGLLAMNVQRRFSISISWQNTIGFGQGLARVGQEAFY